jgi:hypothetical protein
MFSVWERTEMHRRFRWENLKKATVEKLERRWDGTVKTDREKLDARVLTALSWIRVGPMDETCGTYGGEE